MLGLNASSSSIIYLADTHLGEGCNSSDAGYRLNDTNCYSVRHLNATVVRINSEIALRRRHSPVRLVVVGGDLTSSAQRTEFVAAKELLDRLQAPYIPIMGNHDVWSYDEVTGDLTPTPAADELFASVFAPTFERFAGLVYPNASAHNPQRNCTSRFQSWELRPRAADFGDDLARLVLLAPDFNTRRRAPPPCPGRSPVGGCGVPGMAELHDFGGGVLPWFETRLDGLARAPVPAASVLLLTHQPFRCRYPVPDWVFCFSGGDKAALRGAIDRRGVRAAFWGQLAGHQHRWWDGRAFDEPVCGEVGYDV